jgi:hypothetical protein
VSTFTAAPRVSAAPTELVSLRKAAAATITWLLLALVGSGVFLVYALAGSLPVGVAWLCILGGTLGSSTSALVSAGERLSHGWELFDGSKVPLEGKPDRFVARMIPLFLIRPFLGAVVGLLAYVGITGGYIIAVRDASAQSFSLEALAFISILFGLFAKTLLEKLRAMFDSLFGK